MASGGGGGGGSKRQRVDERCEAVGSDAATMIPVDCISALPDELRQHILTRLPLKDAIRTGALARGWRDLWKRRWAHGASSLKVHFRSRDAAQRELDALEREPRPRRRLDRFSLVAGISTLKASVLRRFLDYAAECGVEDLHVETASRGRALSLHLPLLSPALVCLSLCRVTVPRRFFKGAQPFRALEVIRLVSVSFRSRAFGKMMALCPSLLTLHLRSCECEDANDWDTQPPYFPKLRSLTIAECGRIMCWFTCVHLRSFRYYGCFSSLPSVIPHCVLSDLHIQSFDESASMMKDWNIHKLRKSLPNDLSSLNFLTISLTGASVLSADGASGAQMPNSNFFSRPFLSYNLPNSNLHSLKELHLLMLEKEAVNLSNLYVFLKTFQCPNLQRLFVQLPEYRCKPMEVSIDQVREEPPEYSWDNLVMVKVINFNWCPSEVQLVSFLLKRARSLSKLLIVSRNVTPMDSPGTPEADLSLLKEALDNGKIMLSESDTAATQPYHEVFTKLS